MLGGASVLNKTIIAFNIYFRMQHSGTETKCRLDISLQNILHSCRNLNVLPKLLET